MIRSEVVANTRAIDNQIRFTSTFADQVDGVATGIFNESSPVLLEDLRYQPGGPRYPIDWTSDKQRKAFFATDGFGRGIPSVRSGKTARAWYAWFRRSGDRFEMTIANSSPHARFLYGDIRPRGGPDPQQRFHRITGWQRVAPKFEFWVANYRVQLADGLHQLAAKAGAK